MVIAVALSAWVPAGAGADAGQGDVGHFVIPPDLAKRVYERLAPLRPDDGCQLTRFDTRRSEITIEIQTRAAATTRIVVGAPGTGAAEGTAGAWGISGASAAEQSCPDLMRGLRQVLSETSAPARSSTFEPGEGRSAAVNRVLVPLCLALVAIGSLGLAAQAFLRHRPPAAQLLALLLISVLGALLRLYLSPHTWLHEFYHAGETAWSYLTGDNPLPYGDTGPTIIRLVARAVGRPWDASAIFTATLGVSTLAVPLVGIVTLQLTGSWPQALLSATLLAALPHHVRFSAAEDLFIYAVTFGLWSTALFLAFVRSGTIVHGILAAVSLALAVQSRPEMIFFPGLLAVLAVLVAPRGWRFLFEWRTLAALAIVAALLVPRVIELSRAVGQATSPSFHLPYLDRYLGRLVLLHADATPRLYVGLLAMGAIVGLRRNPVATVWPIAVFLAFSLFSAALFDNPPYHMRSQVLPTSFTVITAAACAEPLLSWLSKGRRRAPLLQSVSFALVAAALVLPYRGFITERRDQQLEWDFLERTVPRLPSSGRLLTLVKPALDAFPETLLRQHERSYEIIDAQAVMRGQVQTPTPDETLLFYRGMYCYFAFETEPPPEPMSPVCRAVEETYELQPLLVETLNTPGFSWLVYSGDGKRPFEIGFYRLKRRSGSLQ